MDDKIIREKRTDEALKKNLMGLSGKPALIAAFLGEPIVGQYSDDYCIDTTGYYEQIDIEDNELPVLEYDQSLINEGYHFNGLKYGKHIEITCFDYDNLIKIYYKGYKVYEEINGSLECYNPFDEWESIVNYLYNLAEQKGKKMMDQKNQENKEMVINEQKSFFKRMREKWGI